MFRPTPAGGWRDEGYRAVRAPWADAYAEAGAVPQSALTANGWWFECSGCGHTVNEDWLDERGLSCDGVIGTPPEPCYCCSACKDADDAKRLRVDAARRDGLNDLRTWLLKRFPDAVETTCHGYARDYDGVSVFDSGRVCFRFPGQKVGDAMVRLDRGYLTIRRIGPISPEVTCRNGDVEAFEAWSGLRMERTPYLRS